MNRRAGADAGQNALFFGQPSPHGQRFLAGDVENLVDDARIQHVGHEARTDALDFVLAGRAARQHRGLSRLDGDDLTRRFPGFEHFADAGDGAAGAHTRHQDIHFTVGVIPDFQRRRLAVNLRIGRILELLRNEGVWQFGGQLCRFGDSALHAFRARREDHFGA